LKRPPNLSCSWSTRTTLVPYGLRSIRWIDATNERHCPVNLVDPVQAVALAWPHDNNSSSKPFALLIEALAASAAIAETLRIRLSASRPADRLRQRLRLCHQLLQWLSANLASTTCVNLVRVCRQQPQGPRQRSAARWLTRLARVSTCAAPLCPAVLTCFAATFSAWSARQCAA
jgi:hypothetical protein